MKQLFVTSTIFIASLVLFLFKAPSTSNKNPASALPAITDQSKDSILKTVKADSLQAKVLKSEL